MSSQHQFLTALLATALACALDSRPVEAQIVIDGRTVETKAASGCAHSLIPGNQRYVDCGNGTVWDIHTGLLWLRDGSCSALGSNGDGSGTWSEAQSAAAGVADGLDCDTDGTPDLTDGSQSGDWRLATADEWEITVFHARSVLGCTFTGAGVSPSLTDETGTICFGLGGPIFTGVVSTRDYWTATADQANPSQAFGQSLGTGNRSPYAKNLAMDPLVIWPVRRVSPAASTGSVVADGAPVETDADGPCFGDLGIGAERYVDCTDGTVLDTVTGLLWLQDASCAELPSTDFEGRTNWPDAMGSVAELRSGLCGLTDGSQRGDWRLPTEAEWAATIARAVALDCTGAGTGDPPSLTNTAGTDCLADGPTPFVDVRPDYWAETSEDFDPDTANDVNLTTGDPGRQAKSVSSWNVWPVRERR